MTTRLIYDYFQGVSGKPPAAARIDIELVGNPTKPGVSVLAVPSISLSVGGGDIDPDTGYWEVSVIDSDTTGQAIRVRESVNGASVRSNDYEIPAGNTSLALSSLTPVTSARPYTHILTDRSHRQDVRSDYWGHDNATAEKSGFHSKEDKAAWDAHLGKGGLTQHPAATLTQAGFFSTEDKARLNDLWAGVGPSYEFTPDLPDTSVRSISAKMNEAVSVKDWPVSGSDQRFSGSISAGSKALTLTTPSDFKAGQGITVFGAGVATSLATPGAPSVVVVGTPGTTTYRYKVVAIDANYARTASGSEGVTTTGPATLDDSNYNNVTVSTVTGALMYAIYGDRGDGVFRLLTILHTAAYSYSTTWADKGLAPQTPPAFLPAIAPSSALAGVLSTTVASVDSSTSLVLADAAATSMTDANVDHEDTVAFQKALDAVYGAGGGTLFVPPGVYRINNLNMRDRVSLVGAGRSSVLKLRDNSTNWSMAIITGGNVTCHDGLIADLVFDGSHDVLTWSNIQMHGVDVRSGSVGVTIRNCYFVNICGDGIRTSRDGSANPDYPTNTRIVDCRFTNMGRQDIAIVHGYDVLINGCVGDGHLDIEPEALSYHIVIANCDFDVLAVNNFGSNNRIDCTIVGSRFRTGTLWNSLGLVFTGNVIGYLRVSSVKDISITGNVIRLLDFWPAGSNERVTVVGNIIRNVTETLPAKEPLGSYDNTRRVGVMLWKTYDFVIANNVIVLEGEGANNSGTGIYMASSNQRGIIKGHQIINVQNSAATSNTSRGLYLITNAQDILIQGNSFQNHKYCIDINGSSCRRIQMLDNYFSPDAVASGAWSALYAQASYDVLIQGNVFANNSGLYSYGGSSKRIRGNHFLNDGSASYHINFSSTSVEMGRNFFGIAPSKRMNIYNSTVTSDEPTVIQGSVTGTPAASAVVLSYVAPYAFTLVRALPGSAAKAGTAATAETTFDIKRNGTSIGSIVFAAGATSATFTFTSDRDIAAGDLITITAPASPDATLKDIGFMIHGVG